MGRKHRLKYQKRYYLSKQPHNLTVSIPLEYVHLEEQLEQDPSSLIVSISLNQYMEAPVDSLASLLQRLHTSGFTFPPGWVHITSVSTELLVCLMETDGNEPVAALTFRVAEDLSWTLTVLGREVMAPEIFPCQERVNSVATLRAVLDALLEYQVCKGNPEQAYVDLCKLRQGKFHDRTGTTIVAALECTPVPTIRHVDCLMLIPRPGGSCYVCARYRDTLYALAYKLKKRVPSAHPEMPTKHVNYRHLTSTQLVQRMRMQKKVVRAAKSRVAYLEKKLDEVTQQKGVEVNRELHSDLVTIAQENQQRIHDAHSEGSFQQLFWKQQLQAATSSKGMRWHPTMVKWCLYLRHQSPRAYELLRSSGCIRLPSQRTLRDYTYHITTSPGFSTETDQQLMEDANIASLKEFQKHVCLLGDEMHVKEDLVYDKTNGELVGFVNLGDINEHLIQLEHQLLDDSPTSPALASSVFVFMVRGLFTNLKFPYATFPCQSTCGDQLAPLFFEAVFRIERCGFRVAGTTLDGYSANRRFFRLVAADATDIKHKMPNPCAPDREIFFFSDPPHLLKTVRNCLANPRRTLQKSGQRISWKFVEDLYMMGSKSQGLTTQHKLKYEHIYLTSFSKMRVDLAAQVLSDTVAKGVQFFFGEDARETAVFIEKFDKFFDAVNVTNFSSGFKALKAFKMPYRYSGDFRLKWLEEEFLDWLDEWQQEVEQSADCTATKKEKMMISKETLTGLRMTVKSFIQLVQYLFTLPDVKSFLSERISQDPLEKFFGRQRQRGGVNENPNIAQFLKGNQALRVINSIDLDITRGNTRGSNHSDLPGKENVAPLPKRRRVKPTGTPPEEELKAISPYEAGSPCGILFNSLRAATDDKGFHLPSTEAQAALATATALLQWAIVPLNRDAFGSTSHKLAEQLKALIKKPPTTKAQREKIWVGFAQHVRSTEYQKIWTTLSENAAVQLSPILNFFLTQQYFLHLLKSQFPLNEGTISAAQVQMSVDEESALRYVGGYMLRSLQKKIENRKPKLMEEMILALYSFREDSEQPEESGIGDGSESEDPDWVTVVDRGGLLHCRIEFIHFLCAVEIVVKREMTRGNEAAMKAGFKEMLTARLHKDEDVLFWWATLCAITDVNSECCEALLLHIVSHYIVIRGFAFATRWMEAFKRGNKKNLQRSKSLRNKLQTTTTY